MVLKRYPNVGVTLYRLRAVGGRAGFDMDSHVFPQGVLAAIALVGCGCNWRGVCRGL